ncbi:DUF1203 domain-containing protein [Pseudoxanthomonas dokdonensis]|uniref:DUF1203 domain-containing protein n=1 Tax=Pseudoxanthomonas dokdonensis TaxID=344882 RepID=UPI000AE030B6|nr:DUF1203 domain-containing protein [Pseudoxanthomonas dokdonensis]
MSTFQLIGLPAETFAHFAALSPAALATLGVVRVIADKASGFPCRVSLRDAEIGEELYLLPYLHQSGDSPYKASGPIFVRRNAVTATLPAGAVPGYVSRRQMSLRGYDSQHMMVSAEVCDGDQVGSMLEAFFAED